MLHVSVPSAFVFCHHAVFISFATVELKTLTMPHHFDALFKSLLLVKGFDL